MLQLAIMNTLETNEKIENLKKEMDGNSLVVQWLGLCAFTA